MRFTPALLATVAAVPALAAPQPCGPLELIYARATTEPPGAISATASIEAFDTAAAKVWSKGFGAAGASLFSNVTALIPGATGWPVHYPADWKGCVSEDKGISDLLARIAGRSKECPATKFVLGGHSQGGVVTVRAIPQIPKDLLAKVVAVTMFGVSSFSLLGLVGVCANVGVSLRSVLLKLRGGVRVIVILAIQ